VRGQQRKGGVVTITQRIQQMSARSAAAAAAAAGEEKKEEFVVCFEHVSFMPDQLECLCFTHLWNVKSSLITLYLSRYMKFKPPCFRHSPSKIIPKWKISVPQPLPFSSFHVTAHPYK
jgi:hypothetical protein